MPRLLQTMLRQSMRFGVTKKITSLPAPFHSLSDIKHGNKIPQHLVVKPRFFGQP